MSEIHIGALVWAVRRLCNLTQREAAAKIGVSRRSLQRWENFVHDPHHNRERTLRELLENWIVTAAHDLSATRGKRVVHRN